MVTACSAAAGIRESALAIALSRRSNPSHRGQGTHKTRTTLPLPSAAATFKCAPPISQPSTYLPDMSGYFNGGGFAFRLPQRGQRSRQLQHEPRGIDSGGAVQSSV